MPKRSRAARTNGANVGFERELWQAADALRGSMDAAEYKHVVLGLLPLDALVIPLVVAPPRGLVAEFSKVAAEVHSRVEAGGSESRTLAALRDALLPKLISGDVRVVPAVINPDEVP